MSSTRLTHLWLLLSAASRICSSLCEVICLRAGRDLVLTTAEDVGAAVDVDADVDATVVIFAARTWRNGNSPECLPPTLRFQVARPHRRARRNGLGVVEYSSGQRRASAESDLVPAGRLAIPTRSACLPVRP